MFKSPSALAEPARRSIAESLNATLADGLDLHSQIKVAHWNVKGMHFAALHPLFENFAVALAAFNDQVAERAVTLGAKAYGTARHVAKASTLAEYPQETTRDLDHVKLVLERIEGYLKGVRKGRDQTIQATQFVEGAAAELSRLEGERENVSQRLRDVHRGSGATGDINARKKALNGEITVADQKLAALQKFERDLSQSVEAVTDLLSCPTCGTRADPRRHFKAAGQHFSCTCSDCSTTWGTIACGRCSKWIPILRRAGADWATQAGAPGWVDRTLGADVLAIPWFDGAKIGFTCPSRGDTRGDALTPTAA